jgi:hypothetical protein
LLISPSATISSNLELKTKFNFFEAKENKFVNTVEEKKYEVSFEFFCPLELRIENSKVFD